MTYLLHLVTLIAIYSTLSISLGLLVGQAGLFSLAQASFFAVGAYAVALNRADTATLFWTTISLGATLSALSSLLVSLPSGKFRGDYFVLVTFSFQIITFDLLNNLSDYTKGSLGVTNIPPANIFGWTISGVLGNALISVVLAVMAFFVVQRLVTSPFGRVLRSIREDEMVATATAHNVMAFKICAIAIAASLSAVAGATYAHYFTYVDPTTFKISQSILVLAMVIIGGAESRIGPIAGAALLVLLPEAVRFLGLSDAAAGHIQQIFYGALIAALMILRPQGLFGRYGFS